MGALYLRISKTFAESMAGKESAVIKGDHFGYAVTLDGRYVCAPLSAINFPEDFVALKAAGGMAVLVVLEESDLPVAELPGGA